MATEFMIELEGTPEEVQEMLNNASRIEGATAYRKQKIAPNLYRVWYRGKADAPNDLVAAIKRAAGLTRPKSTPRKVKAEPEAAAEPVNEETDGGNLRTD